MRERKINPLHLKNKMLLQDLSVPKNIEDLADLAVIDKDIPLGYTVLERAMEEVRKGNIDCFKAYRKALRFLAYYDFDKYCQYLELDREPEKRFYLPRRNVLKVLVDDLQDLEDRKIEFLGISLPPRVGKSTLCIFFMTWIMGRHPNDASIMSGHSDKLTDGFYREILSIIDDTETYNWHEIFPELKVVSLSAKNETIDLDRKKRFPTMTCRSVTGTLTGAVEVGNNGILYCDDLVSDLEESLNPQRLENKYNMYLNQLKDRKKKMARELMVGTRWNVLDPLGRIQAQYENNPKYRFRVMPALNENDESNFDYEFDLGFDTKYYKDMRESIDDATWWAKYMGKPYVREGIVFNRDELNYYNGVLPSEEPDRIMAVCDVAWGGGDSLSMPIAYIYGDDIYIHDWVFDNGDKSVTKPIVMEHLKGNNCQTARFEANNGGDEYADDINRMLREKMGYSMNIKSVRASGKSGKVARILQYAPDIKKFYFRDYHNRNKQYQKAMEELCTFVQIGKNLHDDAPDSLAMLAEELVTGYLKPVKFTKRLF